MKKVLCLFIILNILILISGCISSGEMKQHYRGIYAKIVFKNKDNSSINNTFQKMIFLEQNISKIDKSYWYHSDEKYNIYTFHQNTSQGKGFVYDITIQNKGIYLNSTYVIDKYIKDSDIYNNETRNMIEMDKQYLINNSEWLNVVIQNIYNITITSKELIVNFPIHKT